MNPLTGAISLLQNNGISVGLIIAGSSVAKPLSFSPVFSVFCPSFVFQTDSIAEVLGLSTLIFFLFLSQNVIQTVVSSSQGHPLLPLCLS